jgi:competence protein ComEA
MLLIIVSFLFIYFQKEKSEVMYSLGDLQNEVNVVETKEMPMLYEEALSIPIEEIPLFICGEVLRPGVYYVPVHTLIYEVVEKAGGFTKEANTHSVNLAREVVSNERIYIPSIAEKNGQEIGFSEEGEPLVNINTASLSVLQTLPGIGETRAKQIVSYRQQKGFFGTKEDLKNVSGIGEKIYESLKELITIE